MQYIIMVYKLSRNMVTELETLSHYIREHITRRYLVSSAGILLGLNPAKILIPSGSFIQADGLDDHLGH